MELQLTTLVSEEVCLAGVHCEREVAVGEAFGRQKMIDVIGIAEGHFFKGERSF